MAVGHTRHQCRSQPTAPLRQPRRLSGTSRTEVLQPRRWAEALQMLRVPYVWNLADGRALSSGHADRKPCRRPELGVPPRWPLPRPWFLLLGVTPEEGLLTVPPSSLPCSAVSERTGRCGHRAAGREVLLPGPVGGAPHRYVPPRGCPRVFSRRKAGWRRQAGRPQAPGPCPHSGHFSLLHWDGGAGAGGRGREGPGQRRRGRVHRETAASPR